MSSAVDIKNASYTNTIGAVELKAVLGGPRVRPEAWMPILCYIRALQIPTPRSSTYNAKRLGVAPPTDVPATVQERAWSSPIWYTPSPSTRQSAARGVTVADLVPRAASRWTTLS